MTWTSSLPHMGDIVRVKVKFYHHYGIFLDDNTVVQFGMPDNSGVDPKDIAVIVTDIDTFLRGGELEVAKLSLSEKVKRFSPRKTKEIALGRVGETGYNILHNNCEHFVNECVFGKHDSFFVKSVREEIRDKCNK